MMIEKLTNILPESVLMAQQYNRYPYPQWVVARPQDGPTNPAHIDILVAGCGTGLTACQLARQFPNARITAMDLSDVAVRYGATRAELLALRNIRWVTGDILALHDGMDHYDVIECGGVLHHLRDPMKGWRHLLSVLYPHGLMRIGLYNTAVRARLQPARDWLAMLISTTDWSPGDDVTELYECLLLLPDHHPAKLAVASYPLDMATVDGFHDLLMNMREVDFTQEDIVTMVLALGLRITEWEKEEPMYIFQCRRKEGV